MAADPLRTERLRRSAAAQMGRICLGAVLCLCACAPLRDPAGLALEQGRPAAPLPKALRADLEIGVLQPPGGDFTARLYAEPHRRYRLDAYAFPGVVAASFLWDQGHWTLLLPSRHLAVQGTGDTLRLGDGRSLPDLPAALGFLWGEPLPDYSPRSQPAPAWSGDTLRWTADGTAWLARFDLHTGACREVISPQYHLSYGPLRRRGARVLPAQVEIAVDGAPAWVVRVRGLEEVSVWAKDPFALPIPPGYTRRGPEE